MKSMKKIVAIMLTAIVIASMAIPALADDPKGSITIDNAVLGQDYTYYKVFDLTYDNLTGGSQTVMYMTDNTALLNLLPSESDETAMAAAVAAYKAATTDTTKAPVCPFYKGSTVNGKTTVYHLKKYDESIKDDAAGRGWLLKKLDTWKASATKATVTATGNELKFSNIPLGYYLITTTNGTEVIVNSTTPDVTVYDKNDQGPKNPQKTEDKITVQGGNVVTYVSTVETANYVNNDSSHEPVLQFTVNDTWDNGLTFNNDETIELYKMTPCTKTEYEAVTDANLKYSSGSDDDAKYYKLTLVQTFTKATTAFTDGATTNKGYYSITTGTDASTKKDNFVITLPWSSFTPTYKEEKSTTIDTVKDVNAFYPAPGLLKVKYSMTVNDEIFANQNGVFKADNTVNFKYDKEVNGKYVTGNGGNNKTVTVYSFGFSLRKTDSAGNTLSGAKFKVYQGTQKEHTVGEAKYKVFKDKAGNEYYLIPAHEEEDPQDNTQKITVPDTFYAVSDNAKYEGSTHLIASLENVKYYAGPATSVAYEEGVATNITAGAEAQVYKAKWETDSSKATVLTADNSYKTMEVVGLLPGTYYVEEVDHPAGYDLPEYPFIVTVAADETKTPVVYSVTYDQNGNTGDTKISSGKREADENAFETVQVYDATNSPMPTTGGAGTVALLTFGALAFLGTAIILVTKKRLYNEG